MVLELCLHCDPCPLSPFLIAEESEPPAKGHPWDRIALSSLGMHRGLVQGRDKELT